MPFFISILIWKFNGTFGAQTFFFNFQFPIFIGNFKIENPFFMLQFLNLIAELHK